MARLNSFHLPPEDWRVPYVLRGEEAHHLIKVLRGKPGQRVRLFDGAGREGIFLIESLSKKEAVLTPESVSTATPPPLRVHLALAWNKAARRGWLLEKAVELEAGSVIFWQAVRSQGEVPDEPKDTWRAQLVAGAKQCANPFLPELAVVPDGVAGLAAMAGSFDRRFLLWEEHDVGRMLAFGDMRREGDMLMVLGPEGGFEKEEAETLMAAGFEAVSLGRRVLRWETAALLALGIAWWAGQVTHE